MDSYEVLFFPGNGEKRNVPHRRIEHGGPGIEAGALRKFRSAPVVYYWSPAAAEADGPAPLSTTDTR